ncbi:hypothetical protein [Brachyspira sp.]|uniref:hypothetical protein n=1 Tax=Brachyspira sp. TaxID=1977261 RepID=UPI003D7C4F33
MTIINAVKKERKGKERKGKERKGKERKGKERKGKGLLYLIAIAVLISIVFIACKKKPTGMNDFETDIIDISQDTIDKNNPTADKTGGSAGNNGNTLTDEEIKKLGDNISSYNFRGYYFESEDGKVKAQVVRMGDGSGSIINALKLKTETDSRTYELPSARNANNTSAGYRVFECPLLTNRNVRTEATFYNGGKLTLKLQNSAGTSYTLTLALKGKFLDSSDDSKTIDKIG